MIIFVFFYATFCAFQYILYIPSFISIIPREISSTMMDYSLCLVTREPKNILLSTPTYIITNYIRYNSGRSGKEHWNMAKGFHPFSHCLWGNHYLSCLSDSPPKLLLFVPHDWQQQSFFKVFKV